MPEKLPQGWVKTALGELVQPSRVRAVPSEFPDMPFVGLEHIEPHTMRLIGHGHAHEVRSSAVRFSTGDILYGKMRPYLNKVWVAEFDGLCSSEFLVFPKCDGLNSRFLASRLNSDDFVTFSNEQISGERPRVNFNKLSDFAILLPPAAEQDRIAAKLNTVLTRTAGGTRAANNALQRLERYRASVLHTAVIGELTSDWRKIHKPAESGVQLLHRLLQARRARWEEAVLKRLRGVGKPPKEAKWKSRYPEPEPPKTNTHASLPKEWASISIDQLGWASGYGTSVKCSYEAKGPAVLRIPNIRECRLDFQDMKFANSETDFVDDDFVAPGDLLLIRTNGSKDLIGRAAVVCKAPQQKCSFASYLIRFRLVGDATLWAWVSLAWSSDELRSEIQLRAATTAGQYNVSLSGLANLALPLPPITEQVEIVHEVERRLRAADRLAANVHQQLDRASATRQSVLDEAFAGQFVPQDPNDEPAAVLLERIRAARAAEAKKPKAKRMSKTKSKPTRRPLLEVLREHKKPMTPEQLFRASGYQHEFDENECRQEIVDQFYEELRALVTSNGPVREKRPNWNTVQLELTT